jgi:hypothetical protein
MRVATFDPAAFDTTLEAALERGEAIDNNASILCATLAFGTVATTAITWHWSTGCGAVAWRQVLRGHGR